MQGGAAQIEQALVRRLDDPAQTRSDRIRWRTVRQLHLRVAAELRGLSAEAGAALLLSLCNRCVAMLHGVPTRPLHTQLGALELLDLLLDAAPSSSSGGGGSSGNSGSDTVLIRVANAVRLLLQQHATSDPALLHAAASVLGHLARLGSPLTADLVSFQAKQAFEWLQQSAAAASTGAALAAAEQRQLAAVLVLKQLAANAPTLFNTHAPFFFDLLGGPVQALRVDVREAAVLALRVCLVDMASRSERWRRSCWLKIFEQAQEGMEEEDKVQQHRRERSGEYKTMDGAFFSTSPRQQYRRMDPAARTARIHGSLLLLGELLKHASADFLSPRFRTIADLLMRHRHDSSKTVQRSVLTLLPRVAKINPEQFRQDYLAESVAYVSAHMEADQRDTAFLALGRLAAPMTDALLPSLPALVPKLAASLSLTIGMLPSTTAPPSSTKASSFFGFPFSFAFGGSDHSDKSAQDAEEPADPHAERNWSYRRFTYAAMTCVGQLAEGLGEQFQPHVEPLIDVLMQTGLSQSLVDTLDSIGNYVPSLLPLIQDRLFDMLSQLLTQAWSLSPQQRSQQQLASAALSATAAPSSSYFGFKSAPAPVAERHALYSAPPEKLFQATLPEGRVPMVLLSPSSRLAAIRTPAEVAEHDRAAILLALRSLASFSWHRQEAALLALVREVVLPYLRESEEGIRLQAAVTMATLVRILAATFAHSSLSETVFDLLKSLIVLCISDPSATIRVHILSSFTTPHTPSHAQRQRLLREGSGAQAVALLRRRQQAVMDTFLCQSELLSSMALCLNDESFAIRERVLALLSSLAPCNPTIIQPILRGFLIQLLHSLQHQSDDMEDGSDVGMLGQLSPIDAAYFDADVSAIDGADPSPTQTPSLTPTPLSEQNAKLLLTLISYPGGEKLCCSYAHAILQVLLPKLTHVLTAHSGASRRAQPALLSSLSTPSSAALSSLPRSSQLTSYILSTLGKLSILAGADMRPSIALLLQLIIETLQSSGAAAVPDDEETVLKRTVAIRTLGQLITSTGNVIEPYMHYPSLLPTLLSLMQDDRTGGRIAEGARSKKTAGLLGTEDASSALAATATSGAAQQPSLSFSLTSSSQRVFRLELLKLLAKLGVLNPTRFRHSAPLQALQDVAAHHHASLTGAPPASTVPGLGSVRFLDAEPQLSDLMAQSDEPVDSQTVLHETYFPTVALRALLRILLNPRLAHLHVLVLRAILFIFRSIGAAKAALFLPSIMPLLLREMSTLATQSMTLPTAVTGPAAQLYSDATAANAAAASPSQSPGPAAAPMSAAGGSSDTVQLQLGYLQHLTAITRIVGIHMRSYLPQLFSVLFTGQPYAAGADGDGAAPSLQLPYWSEPSLTSSILRLIETVSLSMRAGGGEEEFKRLYLPVVMSKLLQLLQHCDHNLAVTGDGGSSSSSSSHTHLHPAHATHVLLLKVLHTMQVLGGSGRNALEEFLHSLLPTLLRILERTLQQLPREAAPPKRPRHSLPPSPQRLLVTPAAASTLYQLSVGVLQTLSVLVYLHDCRLHASRLIHVLSRFFQSPKLQPSSLTEACLQLLCGLMTQQGFDFLLFEQTLQSALRPLIGRYEAHGLSTQPPLQSATGSPQFASSATPQAQRKLSTSSSEGSLSLAGSPLHLARSTLPRRSPSAMALTSGVTDGSLQLNYLQRFHGLLAQLKNRLAEVRGEKQPVRPEGEDDGFARRDSRDASPTNLSSKDFFHLPLLEPLDVPAGLVADEACSDDAFGVSANASRTSSFTDLASLSEHGGDTDGEGEGSASPAIQPVALGPKKLRFSQSNLQRAWTASSRSTRDDWLLWMRGLTLELLKESPSPALRACSFLAQKYPALAHSLFHAAFLAVWPELSDPFQDDLVSNLEFIFARGQPVDPARHVQSHARRASRNASPVPLARPTPQRSQQPSPAATPHRVPSPGMDRAGGGMMSVSSVPSSIITSLLGLCEYCEHMEASLPLSISLLGQLSVRCHAFATALHYQEIEFHQTSAASQLASIAASPSDVDLTDMPNGGGGSSGGGTASSTSASIQAAEATVESLISNNNKLGQKAAADGILKLLRAQQVHALQQARRSSRRSLPEDSSSSSGDADSLGLESRQAQVLIKPIWLEKLERWEDALEAYEQRQEDLLQLCGTAAASHLLQPSSPGADPFALDGGDTHVGAECRGEYIDVLLGKMRCLRALGEWEQLASFAQGVWNRTDDAVVRRELCPLAAAAACKLNLWDSMEPLFMYFDEHGAAASAAAATSPLALYRSSTGTMARSGSEQRHRFDSHYYHAIFLTHRARYDEARSHLDRAVEVLDPQLTALAGESYQRAYKSLLLLQRVGQLEEIIDFKLSGTGGGAGANGSAASAAPLTPRQSLLQRMWSSRMLDGLSRSGEDIEAWSELLMQQQLLRPPNSPFYSEHNLELYLELCEICRKQALDLGTAATDVPLATTSLNGALRKKKNPFLLRSERILSQLIGFSPLELLPGASGTSAGLVPSMLRLQQVLESTRPRTKLPHLLFSIYKNLYAQGYRLQAFHRLRDMVLGQMEGDVFSIALREALAPPAQRPTASGPGYHEYHGPMGSFLGVAELEQLKALCYIRLGRWQMSMLDESLSQRTSSSPTDTNAPCTPYSPVPTASAFTFSYPLPDLSASMTSFSQQQQQSHASFLSGAAQSLKEILDFFKQSTTLDPSSVRAWHEYAMLHSKVCTTWKFLLAPHAHLPHGQSQTPLAQPALLRTMSSGAAPPPHLTAHIVAGIHAFFRSIYLQPVGDNSLQDILRILALWFEFGAAESVDEMYGSGGDVSQTSSPMFGATLLHSPATHPDPSPPATISAAMLQGLNLIALDNWLTVIPQLIARIHVASPAIRKLLLELLCRVGRAHPQALVYPLTVASKSLLESRRVSALDVLAHMRSHSSTLVSQAAMVSTQLVRVAILFEEMWHEGLEEASRHWYSHKDFPSMMRILEPLHALLGCGEGMSIREAAFLAQYGKDLGEALDLCRKYERAMAAIQKKRQGEATARLQGEEDARIVQKALAQEARHAASYIARAWEVYAGVFRRLHKTIASTHELELSDISPQLLLSRDLELAVPGSYRAGSAVVRIALMEPLLRVIDSKQHPRRLALLGSDGVSYPFLLKGHEDLRQDERVMQLFGLVNTLLSADHATSKSDLAIRRYAVVPLSPNSGLIEWVPGTDPIHTVIKRYRDARNIALNIEQRLMLKHAPDDGLCTNAQRVEIFDYALSMTTGQDLARVMWLHAATAETWLERRTNFTSSAALMSIVGYVLGLGDRHTCNILLSRNFEAVHIDFGDCFEVSMQREKFPEKVPFRLTRMFVAALDVAGIDGAFRHTAERCMRVLRKNKNSIMAVLEAFSLDPLLNWRLLDVRKKPAPSATNTTPASTSTSAAPAAPRQSPSAHNNQQLLAPVLAPHSHVASTALHGVTSDVVPVLAEHLLIAQGATNLHRPPRNVTAPPSGAGFAPATSILGMLTQPSVAAGAAAAAHPTDVPGPTAAPPSIATARHLKAEAAIVAGAAEPGFGSKAAAAGGVLGAVDEGDEENETLASLRPMPPSPAPRRRSVVDESALALVRAESEGAGARDGSAASHSAASMVVNSRLEQLNQQAQLVMARVEMKLKGTEFANELCGGGGGAAGAAAASLGNPVRIVGFHIGKRVTSDSSSASVSASPSPTSSAGGPSAPNPTALTVAAQVQRLIEEATSHVNLAQMYIGWCPFW